MKNVKPSPIYEIAYVEKECNLRIFPSIESDVLSTIPKGSNVKLLEDVGEWTKVRYLYYDGYVKSSLIKLPSN
jgi:uncharacterized protein YgiM (DUF1202 family)